MDFYDWSETNRVALKELWKDYLRETYGEPDKCTHETFGEFCSYLFDCTHHQKPELRK
jgi:hypothetical protein